MTRVLPLLLLLAVAGCSAMFPEPGNVIVPDDDDDDTVANDDDSTTANDDDSAGGDSDGDGDDDSAGDDDDSLDACDPKVVLGVDCAELNWRTLTLAGMNCPVGTYMASDAVEWAALLTQCGVTTDPLVGHLWLNESVVGFVDAGSGCDAAAEVLWAVHCGGRNHVGEAFAACGECGAVPSAGAWAAVPAGTLPLDSRQRCVPEELACD